MLVCEEMKEDEEEGDEMCGLDRRGEDRRDGKDWTQVAREVRVGSIGFD